MLASANVFVNQRLRSEQTPVCSRNWRMHSRTAGGGAALAYDVGVAVLVVRDTLERQRRWLGITTSLRNAAALAQFLFQAVGQVPERSPKLTKP